MILWGIIIICSSARWWTKGGDADWLSGLGDGEHPGWENLKLEILAGYMKVRILAVTKKTI